MYVWYVCLYRRINGIRIEKGRYESAAKEQRTFNYSPPAGRGRDRQDVLFYINKKEIITNERRRMLLLSLLFTRFLHFSLSLSLHPPLAVAKERKDERIRCVGPLNATAEKAEKGGKQLKVMAICGRTRDLLKHEL